jgi:type IX secretion system PorP/SprF family membrane protein
MMKKYFLVAALLGSAAAGIAQQLQSSSMYDMQGILHNPSLAGIQQDETIKGIAGASYRNQWSGISGSPQTVTVFGSFELPEQKIGIGGYIYNDQTGPTSRTGIQLSLAKHIRFNDGGVFSIGLENRLQQYAIDRSKLTESIGNDPVLGASDNRIKYDAGFGISYTNKKFQVGASVSQLVQSKLDFYSGSLSRNEEARLYRHYYFHARYNWDVDGVTTISPNALLIYLPNAPVEVLGGVRVEHNKLLWWGVGYRSGQSYILSAGVHIHKKLTLGYSYDTYRNPVSYFDNGNGAHEVLLRYNFLK